MKELPALAGEVWRGEGYDGPAAVAIVGGSPVAYRLTSVTSGTWRAASGAREVYALRFALGAIVAKVGEAIDARQAVPCRYPEDDHQAADEALQDIARAIGRP